MCNKKMKMKNRQINKDFRLKHSLFERVMARYCGCKDFVGGNWNNGDKAGVSYLHSNNDAGNSNRNIGAHAARGNTPHCLEQCQYPHPSVEHSIRSEQGQYPLRVGTKSREILTLRYKDLLSFSLFISFYPNRTDMEVN